MSDRVTPDSREAATTKLVARGKAVASGLDKAAGGFLFAQSQYPELKEMGLADLLSGTAQLLRELVEEIER